MSGVNKVILVGTLGQDPEIKAMSNGSQVANLSIATSEKWKDKNTGEMKEKTEWHRIAAFNRLAEIMGQYLTKGSQVYIEGKLQTRKWQDQNGQDRYSTEVVAREMQMLGGGKDSGASNNNQAAQQQPSQQPQTQTPQQQSADDFGDDIPF